MAEKLLVSMVSLSRTSLTQCIKVAHSRALATTAHNRLSTNKKQLTKETHSVSETGLAKLKVLIRTLWPLQTLDVQTHYKPTETFQYTHFSSSHLVSVKKGFIKRETLRLLRTNLVNETFEL